MFEVQIGEAKVTRGTKSVQRGSENVSDIMVGQLNESWEVFFRIEYKRSSNIGNIGPIKIVTVRGPSLGCLVINISANEFLGVNIEKARKKFVVEGEQKSELVGSEILPPNGTSAQRSMLTGPKDDKSLANSVWMTVGNGGDGWVIILDLTGTLVDVGMNRWIVHYGGGCTPEARL